MKYLGPFIVGGVLTIGALVAVQWSLVEAPDAPPVEEKAAIDPALLVADLTVPTRSVPGRGETSSDESAAIRFIGVPVSPNDTESLPEDLPEAMGPEPGQGDPEPVDPVETADTESAAEADPEVNVVDAPMPRARPETAPEAEPAVEIAAADTALDAEAAAAARVAGGFDAVAEAPQDETAAAVVALAEAAFESASEAEPEPAPSPSSADPIGDLALANDPPQAAPEPPPAAEVELALAIEPDPSPPPEPEAVADGAPAAAAAPPEPAAVEEAASAEPLTPEPEPVVEIAPAAPAPPEPEPVVEIAPAEPAPPEPVVDVASVEPPAAEPEPAFEPERSAETAEPPVEAAAPAPAEAPPPAEPDPAAAQPSALEVELAALAPTEAVDPSALQFPQVSVLDAGSFRGIRQAKAVVVRLADVRPLPFAERCGPDGVGPDSWHCGGIARAELSRFIGRRPVVCRDERDVSTNARVREVIARCTVGGDDLSLWVAANGWGVPADGAPPSIADAAREAAERAVGRHAPSAPEAAWAGAN